MRSREHVISMEQVEDEKKFKEPFGGKEQARTPKMLSLNSQEEKKRIQKAEVNGRKGECWGGPNALVD